MVNIDPHQGQQGVASIPASLGLPPTFTVHDLLADERYQWRIGQNFVGWPPASARPTSSRSSGEPRPPPGGGPAMSAGPPTLTHLLARERPAGLVGGRGRRLPGAGPPVVRGRAAVVQDGGVLRDPHPRLLRRQRGRLGRLPGPDREARIPAVARASTASGCCRSTSPRCATAATTSPTSPSVHPDYGTVADVQELIDAAHARADPGHRRSGHEPHLGRPPVVPGVALEPGLAQARLVRVVGHRRSLPGRPDHLHRHRDLQLDL